MKKKLDSVNIAIACELTPAKTLIPIIKQMKLLEEQGQMKWNKSKIIALTHGNGVEELIKPYCDEIYSIGKGRGVGTVKRNNIELGYLIVKDILKAIKSLQGKNIDFLIGCGNAGDVRKSIIAANLFKIPILHIEQDIYNPIEVIAYSNLITLPSKDYQDFFKEEYNISNTININGYPMASYINEVITEENTLTSEEIKENYGFSEFNLVVLGGDLKSNDLKGLINSIERVNYPTLIAPYRFKKETVENLVNPEYSNKIKVLEEYVDLISLMKLAKALVYGAGIGMTIEAGVLEVPSLKIAGFHEKHGSVDLANKLNIPIVEISKVSEILSSQNREKDLVNPNGKLIVENSEIAIEKIISIIDNFDFINPPKKSGFKSLKLLWKQRSKYR